MKRKVTRMLVPSIFFISFISLAAIVNACGNNFIFIKAKGDDLDLSGTTNLIIGNIKGDEGRVLFHSKIQDELGDKVYAMIGMLNHGSLMTTEHYFYCPVFKVWFINVWWVMGQGKFRTTDTNYEVFFRDSLPITMPNTEGKLVSASVFMWISLKGEYYNVDPNDPLNPETIPWGEEPEILEGGGWVLAGVFWNVSIPMDFGFGYGILPIGPISYLD